MRIRGPVILERNSLSFPMHRSNESFEINGRHHVEFEEVEMNSRWVNRKRFSISHVVDNYEGPITINSRVKWYPDQLNLVTVVPPQIHLRCRVKIIVKELQVTDQQCNLVIERFIK